MQHLEEALIHAWIDGALPADEAARVESHAASCARCSAMVAEARGLVAASSRIVSALDVTPGGVLPAFGAKPRRRWSVTPSRAAIAATLVIGIGLFSMRFGSDESGEKMKMPSGAPPAAGAITRVDTGQRESSSAAVAAPAASPSSRRVAEAPPPPQHVDRKQMVASSLTDLEKMRPVATPAIIPVPTGTTANAIVGRVPGPPDLTRLSTGAAAVQDLATSQMRSDSTRFARLRTDSVSGSRAASAGGMAVGGGGGGGRRGRPTAPQALSMAPMSTAPTAQAFAGCYELNESTDILPTRFALGTDSAAALAGSYEVRYVDGAGRPSDRIQDAGWTVEAGRAVVKTRGRGAILSILRADTTVLAQSVSGPRTGRVTVCR